MATVAEQIEIKSLPPTNCRDCGIELTIGCFVSTDDDGPSYLQWGCTQCGKDDRVLFIPKFSLSLPSLTVGSSLAQRIEFAEAIANDYRKRAKEQVAERRGNQ